MTLSCSNCLFYYEGTHDTVCRRNPPVVTHGHLSRFPSTCHDQWCGEWKQSAESADKQFNEFINEVVSIKPKPVPPKTVDDDNPLTPS